MKKSALEVIPGVGPSIAKDLQKLGINKVADLEHADAQKLYDQLSEMDGYQDPCVLYTFRCAVYFAKTKNPDPELLKWWNWKLRVE